MTIEQLRHTAFKILGSKTSLVSSVPFFSRLLLKLDIGFDDCETAYTDMESIVFDPAFASRISDDELSFVLLHEVLHCVLNHCIRGKGLNHLVYNIACDIVVNSMVLEILGLRSFTVDKSPVMHITVRGTEGREHTAEEVYRMLMKATPEELKNFCLFNGLVNSTGPSKEGRQILGAPGKKAKGKSTEAEGTGKGNSQSAAARSNGKGSITLGELLAAIAENNRIDSHDEWNNIKDANLLKDRWNKEIKNASRSCSVNGSGIPDCIKRHVNALTAKATINWRQVLHDFIQHNRSDYTYSVPDRRYDGDIIMPSFQENLYGSAADNIWFLIDTSGSVSDKAVAEVYGELVSCISQMDELTGKLSFFDTKVSEPAEFTAEDELLRLKPIGGGGTSFCAIFHYLEKYFPVEERPKAIIILTDGYAPYPKEEAALGIPVIWIISGIGNKAPWGTTVFTD